MEMFLIILAAYFLWLIFAFKIAMDDYFKVYKFVEDIVPEFPYLANSIFKEIEDSSLFYYFFRVATFTKSSKHFNEPLNLVINKGFNLAMLKKYIADNKEIIDKIEKTLKSVDNEVEK